MESHPHGTASHHPPRHAAPPRGMHANGTVPGPHARTPAPTARGWRTPTARPEGEQWGEDKRLTSDAPYNGARHPPPSGTPSRHPHSAQRRLARAHAAGPTPPVRGTHGQRAQDATPAPRDRRPGKEQRLTPSAPHNDGRPTPPGRSPATPAARSPLQGMQAKGTVLDPQTRRPAPTTRGQRAPTARPQDGQRGGDERLTSDAPDNGPRHPPGEALLPPPQRATPACKSARCGAGAGPPMPTPPGPRTHGQRVSYACAWVHIENPFSLSCT